jgi:hypothetical protein
LIDPDVARCRELFDFAEERMDVGFPCYQIARLKNYGVTRLRACVCQNQDEYIFLRAYREHRFANKYFLRFMSKCAEWKGILYLRLRLMVDPEILFLIMPYLFEVTI